MLRRKLVPLSLLLIVMAVFAGAVLATGGPPEQADLAEVKEDAVRAILDSDGRVIDPYQGMAKAARDNEGGFGGWYFSEDKDAVYVFMMDTSKIGAAEAAFNSAYTGQHSPTNVVAVPGTHSLDELFTWLNQMVKALANAEILFRGAEIYQDQNKIKIGLDESASLEDAENIMEELGIPASAIEFSMRSKGRFLSGFVVQSPVIPA